MTALLRIATALGALVVVAAALPHIATVPESDMSASRVVPAVALSRGFPIYAGPDDDRPIIDFMYGPVAAVAFLPAAVASTPSAALAIAVVANLAWFALPLAWLHLVLARRRDAAAAALVLLGLLVVRDPGLAFSAFTIHADAPALGLGALACGLLATARRPLGHARLAAVALAAVLAVWTKQTMAPLVGALLVLVAIRDGVRAAARFAAWLAGIGSAVSAACLLAFGPTALLFNMFTLPSRMPWYREAEVGRLATVGFALGLLARVVWLPGLIAVAVAAHGVRAGGLRAWVRESPTAILAGVALALVPAAILGAVKVGGFLNTFSVTTYFLAAAATIGVALAASGDDRSGAIARTLLALAVSALALVTARELAGPASVERSIARLRAWSSGPQARAYAVARARPGEVYFPWNPLAVLLAEHRLDNNEIGAWNRDLAGVPIPDGRWRARLPAHLRVMAYRPPTGAFAWLPAPTARLPEFTTPASVPGLEGWTILTPAVATPSAPPLQPDTHVAPAPPDS